MFAIEREGLVGNLKVLREMLCGYVSSERFCDCKYGPARNGRRDLPHWGKNTGCPEVRLCAELFSVMTDEEYHNLVELAGGVITSTRTRMSTSGVVMTECPDLWEIIDDRGVIHSGPEEEMRVVFNAMIAGDEEWIPDDVWKGDLRLVQVRGVHR